MRAWGRALAKKYAAEEPIMPPPTMTMSNLSEAPDAAVACAEETRAPARKGCNKRFSIVQ